MGIDVGVGYIPILPDMAGFEEKVAAGASKAGASSRIRSAGKSIGTGLIAGAAAITAVGVERLLSSEKIDKQIAAREKSTRQAANVTGEHIDRLANKLLNLSGTDNEATKSSAALLLTFRSIKNEAGAGNKIFDETQKAILNVAVAMNQGAIPSGEKLKAVTIQVGKAVNDPIKGLGALRRVGVSFTEQQEEQVKALVENGHQMAAQKIILGELNKEFAGSAKAAGSTLQGQLDKTKAKFQNLAGSLVKDLLPIFSKVIEVAGEVVSFFEHHKDFAKVFLAGLAGVGAALLIAFGGPVTAAIAAISGLVIGFVQAYKHSETFRNIVTTVVADVKAAFKAALPWIQNALHNTVEAIKDAAQWTKTAFANVKTTIAGVVKSFKDFWRESAIVRTAVKVIWTAVKVYFGLVKAIIEQAFSQALAVVKRIIPAIEQIVRGFGQIIKGIVEVVSGILTLHFGRAWNGVKNIFSGAIKVVLGYIRGITAPARQIISDIGEALGAAFEKVWDGISSVFESGVNTVAGFIQSLADIINPLLGAIGVGEIHITGSVEPHTSEGNLGKKKPSTSGHKKPHKASGGPVAVPGRGTQDTVPLAVNGAVSAVVAPGEDLMVVNRHQRPLLDAAVAAMYGVGGLTGFYNSYNKPHHAAEGGILPHLPHFSIGSFLEGAAGTAFEIGSAPVRVPAEALFNTAKNAAQFIGGLPGAPHLPGVFGEIASGVLGKVKDWIGGLPSSIFGGSSNALSGGTTASARQFAEYMLQAGFPSEASVIAEGLGTIKSESNFQKNNAQGPSGHIGPWAESPAFGSVKTREDPLGSTEAAYRVGWLPEHSFWQAWGQWEAEQSGLAGGGAGSYASEFMNIAQEAIGSSLRGAASKSAHNHRSLIHPVTGGRGLLPGLASGGLVEKMLGRAKELKNTPYVWGGGHGGFSANPSGLDCSGAVSDVLHAAGLLSSPEASGALESWGSPGFGKNMTVFANAGHAFMEILGHYWGTWVEGGKSNLQFQPTPPASFRHEYVARHSPAVDSESGATGHETKAQETGHTFKENVPAEYANLPTSSPSFGSVPKSLHGVERELGLRKHEVTLYTAAIQHAKHHKRPAIVQALEGVRTNLRTRINELSRARHTLRVEAAKRKFSQKVSKKLGKLIGFNESIGEKERAHDKAAQDAQQIVGLEPQEPILPRNATEAQREAAEKAYDDRYNEYIEGTERPAYLHVLGTEASWRNEILRGEHLATGLEGNWEDKIIGLDKRIEYIGNLKAPKDPKALAHFRTLKAKLPMLRFEDRELRKALGEARTDFFGGHARVTDPAPPNPGSGTLEEALTNVQGLHWPDQHELLESLPGNREAGKFGGLIWDTQEAMENLNLLTFEPGTPSESESESALKALAEQQLQETRKANAVLSAELPVFREFGASRQSVPFGGVFHQGGVVPGSYGEERMALVQSGETILPLDASESHIHVHPVVEDGAFNSDKLRVEVERSNSATVSKSRRTFTGGPRR